MFECADLTSDPDERLRDPRIDDRFIRCLPATGSLGSVLLVGVVHDHPASVFRVTRLLEAISSDALAVELPPLAVPLFRLYGRDPYVPPRLGGEMSAAIQAAKDASIVGIDAPNREYLRSLARRLFGSRPETGVVRTVLRDLASSFAHAAACRIGAFVGAITPVRLRLYSHIEYDCSLLDSPAVQASHEERHLDQRQAFLRAIEVPEATRLIDTAREDGMVDRLHELRSTGDVVAVVGMEHLDGVYAGLAER
jgi:pheromone shutdown protein TraB